MNLKNSTIRAVAAALFFLLPVSANANSCQTLICMSGLVGNGSPRGGCGSHINKYFSIIRFGFWGYSPSQTARARTKYLNSCPGAEANQEWVALINAVYGTVP